MRNPALFSRLFNTPLMIQPTKLDAIIAGIGGRWGLETVPQAQEQSQVFKPGMGVTKPYKDGEWSMDVARKFYDLMGDVAVIDILGIQSHRGGIDANSSYVQAYTDTAKNIAHAIKDPQVKSILLQIDSPGGEVSGAFELAAQIRQAAQIKPVKAVISSMAASAGYLLASAAQEIAISETGVAGSIGVVMRHIDMSKAAEMEGLNITYIYAGDRKIDGNPFEPLPKSVKADLQTQIDKLYSLFVTTVSVNRKIDSETVRAQQAQIYTGQDAIKAGLVDRIATPDEILTEMQTQQSTTTQRRTTMSTPDTGAALEQQALDKARAEGFDAGKKEGQAEGVKAERARHAAVMAHETYAGREALANKMLATTGMTAEEITGLLAESPKAMPQAAAGGQTPFEKEMGKLGVTAVGAGAGDNDPDPDAEARAGWAKAAKPYQSIKGGRG